VNSQDSAPVLSMDAAGGEYWMSTGRMPNEYRVGGVCDAEPLIGGLHLQKDSIMNTTFTPSRVRIAIVAALAAGAVALGGFALNASAQNSDSSGSGGGSRIAMLAR
jgi:hypothetical protein